MKHQKFLLSIFMGVLFLMVSDSHAFSNTIDTSDSKISRNTLESAILTDTIRTTICYNQLPYHWNGITCLTAGMYSATLINSQGNDSTVILNLAVINVGLSITNAITCNNQLPYSWNGNNYAASGTYSVILTSSGGCDSVPILSLTVNDVVTSTTNVAVCSNQLPFAWNGNSYSAAGNYTATLTSAAGCDSIATLRLTVKPLASGTTIAAVCLAQLPFYWNGNSYHTAGNYNDTLQAANGCDSVATLQLTVNTAVNSTTTMTVCNTQLPYHWNGNIYTAAGTYTVLLNSSTGCDSIARLILTVPTVNTSTTYRTVCPGQLPFLWNGNSYSVAGLYVVTLTTSSGCDSIARLRLTIADVLGSTTNKIICISQLPYLWNGNSYSAAGVYSISLVTQAGCDSVATLNLWVSTPRPDSDTIAVCLEQLPYSWHGQVYTAAGVYPVNPPIAIGPCNIVDTLVILIKTIVPTTQTIRVCSNRMPYVWNGNSLSSPGNYSAVLTTSSGCDSSANIVLLVVPVKTSSTSLSVCSPLLPFLWNGNSYDSTGTYVTTLTAGNGCDSVATLHLQVNPVDTSLTDLTICTSQIPYNWNGQMFSSNGMYTVMLTAISGCDSVAMLNLTVNNFLASTTNLSICTSQLPYTWNGNTYSASGTYTVTLPSAGGCDSTAVLNLTVIQHLISTTNVNICSPQLPFSWNGSLYSATGTYTDTLVNAGGCDSLAILNLTVNDVAGSTTTVRVCNNQLPYAWNGNFYPIGGVYPVTLTSASGCDSIAILQLEVRDILTSTTNVSVCNGQLPYTWNGQSYSAGGTYSVTLTNPGGCDSVPILSLTVVPYVMLTIHDTVCTNALPYIWYNNSYYTGGTYTALLTGARGCDSLVTLHLYVIPVISSTTAMAICVNQLPFQWNGNSYASAGIYSLTLTSSSGCDSIAQLELVVRQADTSQTNITVCNNSLPYSWNGYAYPFAGNYAVTLTDSNGCDSVAILLLSVNTVLSGSTDMAICENQLPYLWNGNSCPGAGSYTVTLTGSSGCDSIVTLNLMVNQVSSSNTVLSVCTAVLPYLWNGNYYSGAGNYTVTLTGSSGCDSVANLQLNVYPPASSETNLVVCSNLLPYWWNGNPYATAGDYMITLVGMNGCDSVANLHLTVNDVQNSSMPVSVCQDQLPYLWNGNLYTTAGIYSATFTGSNGCDSLATLDLQVSPVLTSSVNISICSNQLPFSWNGNSYTTGGSYTITLTSAAGCDSIVTLELTADPVVTSTTDVSICSTQLPYVWNGNNYSSEGSYAITLTSNSGCDSVATLHLFINPVQVSSTQVSICNNQLPYTWNGISYAAGGTYNVSLTASTGCDSLATLELQVNPVTVSSTLVSLCSNQLPFIWNGNNYSAPGTYDIILSGSNGCDSVATLALQVNPVLTSSVHMSICSNQLPFLWNGNSYAAGGSYTLTLTSAAGCDSIVTLELTADPVVTSTTDVIICSSQLPYVWNGNSYSAEGAYSITLTGTGGCDSVAVLQLTVNPVATSLTAISICSNQLPLNWNGNNYTLPGIYTSAITGSNGCDSIATLQLTVKQVTASLAVINTCSNNLPYLWNGNSYTASGTYSVTLTGENGCDSVASMQFVVNAVTSSITQIAICNNQLPFTWNGNNYTSEGTYEIILTGSAGCDSAATLVLQINEVSSSITDVVICSNQLPFTWSGNIYQAPGTYVVNFNNQAGCDSIATLHLTVNPVLSSLIYANTCSNQLPYFWNGLVITTGGIHTVTLTSQAGCDSIASLHLSILPVNTSLTLISTCSNQLPYTWNGHAYTVTGMYSVTLTGATGCDSIASLLITVHPVQQSNVQLAVCSGQLPLQWNGHQYTTPGLHMITLTSQAGCDSLVTLDLAIHPTPARPAVRSPVVYCQYESTVTLSAEVTATGNHLLWYSSLSGTTGSVIAPVPTSSNPGHTHYYVSQVSGACESPKALITVTVNSKPDLGPDKSIRICHGESANLSALYNTAGLTVNWIGSQSAGVPFAVHHTGIYHILVRNNSGCSDTASVRLFIQPKVIAHAGIDDNAEYNMPYQLNGSGGGSYQWFPAEGLNNPTIFNPVATLTNDASYVLRVMDEIGCIAYDTVHLRVLEGPAFYVPTAFTPNGDGLNDYFRPIAIGMYSLDYFSVFNRYGQLVFETQNLKQAWDGKYKGLKQNAGNYVWKIKGTDRRGKVKLMKGNVVLIR